MKIYKLLYRLLVTALAAALLYSGAHIAIGLIDSIQQRSTYDELAQQVDRAREDTAPTAAITDSVCDVISTAPPAILPEYAALHAENSDLAGWMSIAGTAINYPVMQSPERPDYYLGRNFKGEPSAHGCLYVREACDVFDPSDNLTIYGHQMKDGSMFTDLKKYRSADFRKEYPTICFDTLYERHTYTIFAVFTTTASRGKGFAYHLFDDAADEADFDDFVSTCKELSLYDTGITPVYGDKLICLSTCEYTHSNGRLVVAAVRD